MFLKLIREAKLTEKSNDNRIKQITSGEVDIIFKQYSGKAMMDFEKFIEALAHVSYICLGIEGDQPRLLTSFVQECLSDLDAKLLRSPSTNATLTA